MTTATPFVKITGGKTQLLPELRRHVSASFNRYFEPFVGGGAFFFDLHAMGRIQSAVLGDANGKLVSAYCGIRNDVERVITILRGHAEKYSESWKWLPHEPDEPRYGEGRAYYLQVRADARYRDDVTQAAWVVFLSKTGFNGIWRENLSGRYNVPPGKYRQIPGICDVENLRAVSVALQGVRVVAGDFEQHTPEAGDFWYADPPYVPASDSADFTTYTARSPFGPEQQERLRDCALRLKSEGVQVLLSNSDTESVRKLYANGFEMRRVEARRSVNSHTGKRGNVGELLIW